LARYSADLFFDSSDAQHKYGWQLHRNQNGEILPNSGCVFIASSDHEIYETRCATKLKRKLLFRNISSIESAKCHRIFNNNLEKTEASKKQTKNAIISEGLGATRIGRGFKAGQLVETKAFAARLRCAAE
jgi:hypothetical protein